MKWMNSYMTGLVCVASVVAGALAAGGSSLDTLQGERKIAACKFNRLVDWTEVPSQEAFVSLGVGYKPAVKETSVQVAYADGVLYVRMTMKEPDETVFKDRERFSLWQNENAEVLIETPDRLSRRAALHMAVDPLGRFYARESTESTEEPGVWRDSDVEPGTCSVVAEKISGGWRATFKVAANGFAGEWGANFCRTSLRGGHSCWSQTKAFRDQKRFGKIVFDALLDNGAKYAGALAAFQKERDAIVATFKKKVYDLRYAWGESPGYRPLYGVYDGQNGCGWLKPVRRGTVSGRYATTRRRKYPYNGLCDNYVLGEEANAFRIDLPDGKYKVHLLAGHFGCDSDGRRREFDVTADGRKVVEFSCGAGTFCIWDFPVVVKGRKVEIGFVPHEVARRPETDGYMPADKCLAKGFCVNSIVIYPAADRKTAARQIATDELELRVHAISELVNYKFDAHEDPEPSFGFPDKAVQRGWAVFSKPLGTSIYRGTRPASAEECADVLRVRAAPGERFRLSFGVLPLRDADGSPWTVSGFPMKVGEALHLPWAGYGDTYSFAPYELEDAAFTDHDLDKGVVRNVWLTGTVPESAKPGTVRASFAIGDDSVPVEIEVLPFALDKVDFAYGGYNPDGYGRPMCYENVLARACADVGINAHVFYLSAGNRLPSSFERLKARIGIYERAGAGGDYVIYCSFPNSWDRTHLMAKKATSIPDDLIAGQVELARKVMSLADGSGYPRFYYSAMDEAHCKGEPYWSEQIRLFKTVKESVPGIYTAGSESEHSYRRSAAYMDVPILFDIPDFRKIVGVEKVWSYPNQAMLEPANFNAGRFCCGLLPSTVPIKGILPWMLIRSRDNSPLRNDPWEMLVERGVGGYRVIPRLVTVMGDVGVFDQRYFATLRRLVVEAENGTSRQRDAAARQKDLLAMIEEGTRPSYMYYYHAGHLPASTFATIRERLVDGILELVELKKDGE